MCLRTHCNIDSKRPCCPLASDAEPSSVISTVHLWRRSVPLQTFVGCWHCINCCRLQMYKMVPSGKRFRLLFTPTINHQVSSGSEVAKIWAFSLAYSAQTVRPPPKLTYKRDIPGMSTSPQNDSHRPRAVWATALSQTTYPRVPYFGLFWGTWKIPCDEIEKFFHRCRHAESDSRLLFQKWSKSVQDKWPKCRVALITQKQNTFWHPGA